MEEWIVNLIVGVVSAVCGLIGGFFGGFAYKNHCVKTKLKAKGNGNIQIIGGISNGEQDESVNKRK